MAAELVVVGTGIRAVVQLTPEARDAMVRCERVLYLVAEPFSARWIEELNPGSESLLGCYREGEPRRAAYARMTERVLTCLRAGSVCLAFYGHPTMLVAPTLAAVEGARALGHPTRVLPGISAEDCLLAELLVDPGSGGLQSYEATDFLLRPKRFDTSVPLVLWQVGILGDLRYSPDGSDPPLELLGEYLSAHYGPEHRVVLYAASAHPAFASSLDWRALADLGEARTTPATTMLVPALGPAQPDLAMHRLLGVRPALA